MTQGYAAGPLACPVPLVATDRVQLGHGSGGKMSAALLRDSFLPHRGNPDLARLGEGAVVDTGAGEIAVSTDIFVLSPLEFPGGDSGALAVHGTFNDVAMMGARPLFLTAVFVLVEGLLVERLERIVRSMGERAASAGVPVITGDTKVVEQGRMASRSILRASASWMPASAPRPTGLARATRCW